MFIAAIFLGVKYQMDNRNSGVLINNNEISEVIDPMELCFVKSNESTLPGNPDKFALKMKLDGKNVTGELKLLPAEKDSLVGAFEGTVSSVDNQTMSRTADLWWQSTGEGQTVKQQLSVIFDESTANIGFGEMEDRGDGVYVYKDISQVDYSFILTDTTCSGLFVK